MVVEPPGVEEGIGTSLDALSTRDHRDALGRRVVAVAGQLDVARDDRTASQGDCVLTVEVLDPGAQTSRTWAGRVLSIVEVPLGCDGTADQIAFPQCTRAVVVEPGSHTFTIDVDPGSDVARTAEVVFDYPTAAIGIDIE